jgi:hypothetical protein
MLSQFPTRQYHAETFHDAEIYVLAEDLSMETSIIIAAISATTAIVVAAITYYTTKERERDAEWRKEKLTHYKEYFAALAGTVGSHATDEARKRYAIAFNTVGLFASQEVIECLHAYQEVTRLPAG